MGEVKASKNKSKTKSLSSKADAIAGEVPMGEGRAVILKPKIRSSLFARFREENPQSMEALNLALSGSGDGFKVRVTDAVMKGLPSGEVISLCAFLGEITREIVGFADTYDWQDMTEEQRTDFFDLEIGDAEKFACMVMAYVLTLGKV